MIVIFTQTNRTNGRGRLAVFAIGVSETSSSIVAATVGARVAARSDGGLEEILKGNQFMETGSQECIDVSIPLQT